MAQPLRRQLLGISAVLALAVLGALFYASRVTYHEQVEQLKSESLSTTAVVVAYVESNLQIADAVAETTARQTAVRQLQPQASEMLAPLMRGDVLVLRNAVVADLSGHAVAWAAPPTPTIEGQLSPEWLAGVAATGRRSMSPVLGGPDHSAHVIVMGYPVAGAGGEVVGVLGLAVHRCASFSAKVNCL
jgi:hypothetical protein